MYLLGYSGLHGIQSFRRALLPTLSALEQNIFQGMDAAACLIYNGEIVAAAEEERFLNEKHTSHFPINAINFCLNEAGITINDLGGIYHGFNFEKYAQIYSLDHYNQQLFNQILSAQAQKRIIKEFFPSWISFSAFHSVEHHLAHAASAYYMSGFSDALIVVADAMGEINSMSVFRGTDNKIQPIADFDLLSSLGMLYSLVTAHLGFKPNEDEYKVMGLAPYGDPTQLDKAFSDLVQLEAGGEVVIPSILDNTSAMDRQTYSGIMNKLKHYLGEPRVGGAEITQHHQNIAAALQKRLNSAMLHFISHWQAATGLTKLCLAGGVGLNCVTNASIAESQLFDNIYIQPAAGDAGTALGSALYGFYYHENNSYLSLEKEFTREKLPLYGPDCDSFSLHDLPAHLSNQLNIIKLEMNTLFDTVAKALTEDKVVAWMNGRMEFGPRALGNRSILANPMNPNMRDKINKIVKKRESFRPFAPSVKLDSAHRFFDLREGCDYSTMLITAQVKEAYRALLPAVTHVDGSARIQTVEYRTNPKYWTLLDRFESLIKIPILLNTSFNVKGQAIVCYAEQGIQTFLDTEIDLLVINDTIITKK